MIMTDECNHTPESIIFFYFSLSICSGNQGGGTAYQELRVKDMLAKHSSNEVCGLKRFSEVVDIQAVLFWDRLQTPYTAHSSILPAQHQTKPQRAFVKVDLYHHTRQAY